MCDDLGISDEKIEVWEVKLFGSTIILNTLKEVTELLLCDLSGLDEGEPEEIVITRKMMRESDVKNLPEFEGY